MSERGGDISADSGIGAAASPQSGDETLARVSAAGGPTPAAPDARHISLRTSLLYASGNFGAGFYYALNSFILSVLLLSLHVEPVLNNLLTSTRSVEGAVVQPLVGAWSDRTWKPPLGRRRYFIVLFAPISALFVALTPFAPHLAGMGAVFGLSTGQAAILLVTATVVLFTFTFNVMYDPYNALLADITPESRRGHVNGIFQGVSAMGQVVLLLAAVFLSRGGRLDATPIFIAVALALVVFFIPTVVGIREQREIPGRITHRRYTVRNYWHALRADGQVQLYFANQFLLWFGISAIQFNLIYYAKVQLGFDDRGALILSFVLLLTSALPVWPLGALGDRIGLKRMFLLGIILMTAGTIAGSLTREPLLLYIILGVAGVGNAAQTASSYPLLTRLVFPEQMGLYTGLSSSITSIAGPAGALLSGLLVGTLEHPHFERLFPFLAALFLSSLIPLAFLRIDRGALARARRGEAADLLPHAT